VLKLKLPRRPRATLALRLIRLALAIAPRDPHWARFGYGASLMRDAERLLQRAESRQAMREADNHVAGRNMLDTAYEPPDGAGQIPVVRRHANPLGDTALLVADIETSHGEAFVRSWLSSRTCTFEPDTIWTVETARLVLERQCGAALERFGVRVKSDDAALRHFNQQTYEISQAHPKKRRRQRGVSRR